MKDISTLVPDIYAVLEGNGGWDATITKFLSEGIAQLAHDRFSEKQEPRDYLSLSSVGDWCTRKVWYRLNMPDVGTEIDAKGLGSFFYGDLCEILVLALAKAAGHTVTGLQYAVDVHGVPGSTDCFIDGWLVDVKSASGFGFSKFKYNQLKGYEKTVKGKTSWVDARDVDAFGYISQLSSYLTAVQNEPQVTQKNHAAFLAINKERFELALDIYDLSEELKTKEAEIDRVKQAVTGEVPERGWEPVPDGASGNMKLPVACGYCSYRKTCWPEARTFLYSGSPRHLTTVKVLPKVPEVT